MNGRRSRASQSGREASKSASKRGVASKKQDKSEEKKSARKKSSMRKRKHEEVEKEIEQENEQNEQHDDQENRVKYQAKKKNNKRQTGKKTTTGSSRGRKPAKKGASNTRKSGSRADSSKKRNDMKSQSKSKSKSKSKNKSKKEKSKSNSRQSKMQKSQDETPQKTPEKSPVKSRQETDKKMDTGRKSRLRKVEQHTYKLYYFDCYARAEMIRMLFHYVGQDFEDIRYDYEGEWQTEHKKNDTKFEFGQCPVLEMDGHYYAQSAAILRLLGRIFNLYPEDIKEAWRVDSMIDFNGDIQEAWWHALIEFDENKKKEKWEKYYTQKLPHYFKCLQARLEKNPDSKFVHGDKMTIADFSNAQVAFDYVLNEASDQYQNHVDVLKKYELVEKYYDGLRETLDDYLKSRPKSQW